jgi:hypothetical protein
VFILNVVKVICFDTLLQVLIVKVVAVSTSAALRRVRAAFETRKRAPIGWLAFPGDCCAEELGYPHPGCPVVAFGIPYPRYFGKRGRKLLKTNDGSRKKGKGEAARD